RLPRLTLSPYTTLFRSASDGAARLRRPELAPRRLEAQPRPDAGRTRRELGPPAHLTRRSPTAGPARPAGVTDARRRPAAGRGTRRRTPGRPTADSTPCRSPVRAAGTGTPRS